MDNLRKLMQEKRELWLNLLFLIVIGLFVLGSSRQGIEQRGYFTAAGGIAIWWAMLTREAFPATLQGIVALANVLAWLPTSQAVQGGLVIIATAIGVVWLMGQIKLDALGWLTVVAVCVLGIGFATGFLGIILAANLILVVQSFLFWKIVRKFKFDTVAIGYLVLNAVMAYNIFPFAIARPFG